MNIEQAREYTLTLPGVTEDMPYGPDWLIFRTDPAVIEIAVTRVVIVLCLYIMNSAIDLLSSLMRAVGYSLVPAIICIVGICGTRVSWAAFVFPSHHTFDWLMYCYPLSWIVTLIFMTPVAVHTLNGVLKKI